MSNPVFWEKNKKNINLSSAEFADTTVKSKSFKLQELRHLNLFSRTRVKLQELLYSPYWDWEVWEINKDLYQLLQNAVSDQVW